MSVEYKSVPKERFEPVALDLSSQEAIARPSLTFWQDARVRLFKNKGAIAAMIMLVFVLFMAAFGPMMNEYSYDQQIQPLKSHAKLPPRVPGLEKLGIFDGTKVIEMGANRLDLYKEGEMEILKEYQVTDESGTLVTRYSVKEFSYKKNNVEDEYFWFGTDDLARDMWTRIWKGTRVSLYVGILAALIDFLIGVTYGAISGFYGGRVDMFMMRFTEIIGGIPWLVIVVMFILVFGSGLFPMSMAIAISGWIGMARVVRAQFLKLRDQEFVMAATTLGTSNSELITRHLLPNVIGQIIVMITFSIPGAIFTEAFLSFIGLGIPAPNASLGSVVNDSRAFLRFQPSMVFIPSTVLSILMLSINIFANGLRDALDPRMRNN